MTKLMSQLTKRLKGFEADRKKLNRKMERDDSSELNDDAHNLNGHIEQLESVILMLKEAEAPQDFKVKKDHTGIFQFAIYLNGAGKNPKEAWESVQDNLDFDDLGKMPDKSDIKLIDQEPEPE